MYSGPSLLVTPLHQSKSPLIGVHYAEKHYAEKHLCKLIKWFMKGCP